MLHYENISNIGRHNSIRMADEFLGNGWTRRNAPTVEIFGPMPWEFPGHGLRSWNFHVHSLDMLNPLLAAHSQTAEEKYITPALRIGLDWVAKHPRRAEGVSPMAWYDMAVGLRAYRLGYLYQAAETAGLLGAADKAALWASLGEHCAELSDDANIAFHNNHGYFQVAGQLALGRRFANASASMAALHAQGVHRLKRMLDQQFGPDGVHREHSPDYHRMVADTLLGLVRAGLVEDPDLLGRVDGIEEALAWFVTPEGIITNFGDSDSRSMIYSAEGASRKWTTPLMRAVASDGATGSGWPKGLRVFTESGYAVVRQPDPARSDDITRDSYLAQTAAFHSRTHKHCDDLSFVWHDAGQPLLVDAGRYGYIGKTETGSDLWHEGFWYSDPMRVYMESTRAHNTLEFDEKNSLRKGVKPYGSALVQACERDGVFCIETRCKQHRSIWNDRLLVFKPGRWLVVFDVFTDNLKQAHEVKQWFHLAPGHKATPVEGGYDVHLCDGSAMSIRSLLGSPAVESVIAGSMDEPIQGWWSEKERTVEPADALAFSQSGGSTGVFATLFTFSPSATANSQLCKSNVTGRKVQLSWEDALGKHFVGFERGEAFSLSYECQPVSSTASATAQDQPSLLQLLGNPKVILEYGYGPLSRWVGQHGGALVIAVHDDLEEVRKIRSAELPHLDSLIVHLAEQQTDSIGSQQHIASEVWSKAWFRQPDAVSIGGASAPVCLQVVSEKVTRNTKVLWRDFFAQPDHQAWLAELGSYQRLDGNHLVFEISPPV